MNGKGSRARPPVNRAEYGNNFDRIFGVDERKWGYALVRNARFWEPAEATTRAGVIDEADGRHYESGFAICRCQPIDVQALLPDGGDVCEQIAQAAFDNYGIEADFPDVGPAAQLELTKFLRAWAAKHIDSDQTPWLAVDIEEFEVTADGPIPKREHAAEPSSAVASNVVNIR